MAKKTKTLTFRHPDRILPHLGTLFGLTEEATVVVLIDMGLLEKRATGVTQICQQQWEHLRDFHQLRGVLEWGNSQLAFKQKTLKTGGGEIKNTNGAFGKS